MGRKSNGNSYNELSKCATASDAFSLNEIFACDAFSPKDILASDNDLPYIEIMRSTPALEFKVPSNFTEAAAMASVKTQERELSARSAALGRSHEDLKPRNIFASPLMFQSDTTGSSKEQVTTSPTSKISESDGSFSNVGLELEGELSVQLLSLSICPEHNTSADSFSSAPESKFNKGAMDFLFLLEKNL